jgi:hypothetical protein
MLAASAAATLVAAPFTLLGSAVSVAASQGTVRTVHRAYGDGPVNQRSLQQAVEIRFHGDQGDRVTLANRNEWHGNHCPPITLTRDGRTLAADRTGYWRLPRSATYTFTFVPCRDNGLLATLQLTRLVVHDIEVDGPAARWTFSRGYTHGYWFFGKDGQLVYPQVTDGPHWAGATVNWRTYRLDLRPMPQNFAPGTAIRRNGDYLVVGSVRDVSPGDSATVRVRSALRVPRIAVDGTPTAFATDSLGRWVLSSLRLDDRSHQLVASDPAFAGTWSAEAAPLEPLVCPDHGPIGCGENATGRVDAKHLVSQLFGVGTGGPNPWIVLLRVPPTVSGSVDLAAPPAP